MNKIAPGIIKAIGAPEANGLSPVTIVYVANDQKWEVEVELPAPTLSVGQTMIVECDSAAPKRFFDIRAGEGPAEAPSGSIIKSIRAIVWEAAWEFVTTVDVIYVAAIVLVVVFLRHLAHGNALVDRFFPSWISVALALTFFATSALDRASLKRTTSLAALRNATWKKHAGFAFLGIAAVAFLINLQWSAAPEESDAPANGPPPREIDQFLAQPGVKEGLDLAAKLRSSTTQRVP